MIERTKRITFRLTPAEATEYGAMIAAHRLWDWSHMIRAGLKALKEKLQPRPITTSDKSPAARLTRTTVSPGKNGKSSKVKKGGKTAKKSRSV